MAMVAIPAMMPSMMPAMMPAMIAMMALTAMPHHSGAHDRDEAVLYQGVRRDSRAGEER